MSQQDNKEMAKYFYRASVADFGKIPGSPIVYWAGASLRGVYNSYKALESISKPRQGMATTNNGLFVRGWFEVSLNKISFHSNSEESALASMKKWFPYNKGGEYRKWYGNNEHVVNYEYSGKTICDYIDNTPGAKVGSNGRVINRDKYFQPSVTWSFVSSSYFGVRYSPGGSVFDVGGSSIFMDDPKDLIGLSGLMCSKLSTLFMSLVNPTLNFQVGNVCTIPVTETITTDVVIKLVTKIIFLSIS